MDADLGRGGGWSPPRSDPSRFAPNPTSRLANCHPGMRCFVSSGAFGVYPLP